MLKHDLPTSGRVRERWSVDPRSPEFAEKFGAYLLGRGAIDDLSLQRTLRAARQSGERFDHVLTKLGLVSESDLCHHLAQFLQIELIDDENLPHAPALPNVITEKFVRANGLLPLSLDGTRLTVALVDPFNLEAIDALAYSTDYAIDLRLITPAHLEKA